MINMVCGFSVYIDKRHKFHNIFYLYFIFTLFLAIAFFIPHNYTISLTVKYIFTLYFNYNFFIIGLIVRQTTVNLHNNEAVVGLLLTDINIYLCPLFKLVFM